MVDDSLRDSQVAMTPETRGAVFCSYLIPGSLSKFQDLLAVTLASSKIHDHSMISHASCPSSYFRP